MSLTVAQFKKARPEFRDTEAFLVGNCIEQAKHRVSASVFGDSYTDALILKAAHLLSIGPAGEQAKLRMENRGDSYEAEFKTLAREVTMGLSRVAR